MGIYIRKENKSKSNFAASWLKHFRFVLVFWVKSVGSLVWFGKCLWPHWRVACLINVFADLAVDL